VEKKLTKHGNSVALIIDKALLKLLKMDESTIVTIAIKDNTLLITPTKKKSKGTTKKAKNGNALTDGLIEEYKETFKKLAKT
jgi:antitoxin component of MazEF toxin-antitoxin module